MKTKNDLLEEALLGFINGNSKQVYYDRIINYSKQYVLPINESIEKEDIIIDALARFYEYRKSFDNTKSNIITYWTNYLKMNSKSIHQTETRQKRIPSKLLQRDEVRTSSNDIINLFDIIDDDTFIIDTLLNDSNDVTEDLKQFILENNLDVLYTFFYTKNYVKSVNSHIRREVLHKEENMTYEKLTEIFDLPLYQVKNKIYHQKQFVIKHFEKYLVNKYKDNIFYENK